MSEEILKALMQLFAIISKQDEGVSEQHHTFIEEFLEFQLSRDKVEEYLKLYEEFANYHEELAKIKAGIKEERLTSVKDSVRTLAICKKINKTLTQKQKVVVQFRLFELLKSDRQFTPQRMDIIDTVADSFNISQEELKVIHSFCIESNAYALESEDILVIDSLRVDSVNYSKGIKHIYSDGLDGAISIVHIKSVDLFFVKYTGKNDIFINGLSFNTKNIYLFAPGSTIRVPQGTVYYSDVVGRFMADTDIVKLSFNANNIQFKFPNGAIALRDVNVSEESGKLVGLMGASGAGKTTLLNVLSGIESPSGGEVLINGINIHKEPKKAEGIIGYIAQDDLLIEELTVFENLFYNAKLCFKNLNKEELTALVDKTLNNLGLLERKEVKVGSPLNKKISGGQRKRLNIALELIREPSVLFVDEPTSGLSSRDSENVMDLLKELTLKGKLIFVVIHQPSSDIYKMFDKLVLLDTGGYPIYYGNPIEAIMYFKHETNQINADVGECYACGNVNPELLFNIIELRVIDDFGNYTNQRKISPPEWNTKFLNSYKHNPVENVTTPPPRTFNIPSRVKQFLIFTTRDVKSKISNTQYLLINLLEAPLLAFILAFIIRYVAHVDNHIYLFRENENIPAYIFMSIIVALFIGLTVSAEEIFRDRKILKREAFLNLSRFSYLSSKIGILFFLSAVQTVTFVLVGNYVLGVKGMFLDYWLILFTVSCFANMLGLNISVTFNSAVTIYILIPLLVIPQMILGGAMFSFDKLNRTLGGGNNITPPIADAMVARWAFEALTVSQFKSNKYEHNLYDIEKKESAANYKQVYYLPEIKSLATEAKEMLNDQSEVAKKKIAENLEIVRNELLAESKRTKNIKFGFMDKLVPSAYTPEVYEALTAHVDMLSEHYMTVFNKIVDKKDNIIKKLQNTPEKEVKFKVAYNDYYNENLADLVKKALMSDKIAHSNGRLVQLTEPIYLEPKPHNGIGMRVHFYAPSKYLFGNKLDTLYFNMIIIWAMSIFLFVALYFEWLKKLLEIGDKFNFKKKD